MLNLIRSLVIALKDSNKPVNYFKKMSTPTLLGVYLELVERDNPNQLAVLDELSFRANGKYPK